MPPKTRYSREAVIKAAMSVIETDGLRGLTARRVADELGSSTAPVYKQFATMNDLAMTAMRETQQLLLDYSARPYTDRIFLNMGTGVGLFACQHPRLYRALLLEGNEYREVVHEFLGTLESGMEKDARFVGLSPDERHVLLEKMWTFTHGLASLICVGMIENCNQEFIIKTLMDVGADVIGATLAKSKSSGKNV